MNFDQHAPLFRQFTHLSLLEKVDDPYKVYGALDGNIEYLLEKSILKDYIGRIGDIPIKDAVLIFVNGAIHTDTA